VLAAADGKGKSEIAREVGLGVDRVREWRMRWIGLQAVSLSELPVEERLSDLPRPGRPSEISAQHICRMVAMGCSQPKERPISHWTGREIADEVKRRGSSKPISPRHASGLVKKGLSNRLCFALGSPHLLILLERKRLWRLARSRSRLQREPNRENAP